MYFAKTLLVLAALSTSVFGHAGITPGLGVRGKITRNQVQRPSAGRPCGNAAVAAIDSSTPAQANGGTFAVTATNFNGGQDGSTQFTAQIDPTGTGRQFRPATVVKNGQLAPRAVGDVPITVQMPTGMTCQGGATGNKCLVSFRSAGGFGNCAVVQSAGGAGGAGGAGAGAGAVGGAGGRTGGRTAAAGANRKFQRNHARDFLKGKREDTEHPAPAEWAY